MHIADTNELADAAEASMGLCGGASLPDEPGCQEGWDLPIVERVGK